MSFVIKKIGQNLWASDFSTNAHQGVFGTSYDPSLDRIDFALLSVNQNNEPVGYVTCKEKDSETLYWQYGGVFSPFRNTPQSFEWCIAQRDYAKETYKRIVCYVENTNKAMLVVALKLGFLITGIRNYKGSILLEHLLEFGEK